jgi:hypothetical protein
MTLPTLTGWTTTVESLHRATEVVAAIRNAVTEPLPNFLHLSTGIRPDGLSTGALSFGEVYLDFGAAEMVFVPNPGVPQRIDVAGHNQASLTSAALALLAEHGQTISIGGHESTLSDTRALEVDHGLGADYARALYAIFTATARFRARLFATMTPIVVWPEHFDLSFLVFAGEASEEHPHMNFGFAPYSDGIDRPYLYAYVWPLPVSGYRGLGLPEHVRLDTPGYGGPLVWYDDLVQQADPEMYIEQTFLGIEHALSRLWDV